ncbi:MAG: hypothetical protein KJO76_07930 [Gammaproteobacteria bacterium]|nr:hypothetical protein [Gammaproteobacteria bacterium]
MSDEPAMRRATPETCSDSPRCVCCALLVASLLWAANATAEFSLEPYIQGGARFDTNPRYLRSEADPESALGTIVDARLPVEWRTQRASLSLRPRIVYSFYPDDEFEDLEDRDNYLIGDASWMNQRSQVGAGYGYTDLSLRTSEFQEAGDSASGGSGGERIFFEDKQRRWYFQPYWRSQLSQKSSLLLNGGYEEVRYDEEIASRRYDYDYSSASATLDRALNYRHKLGLRAQWTKFDSENRDLRVTNDSKTNSLSLVYDFTWSETLQLTADVGWARTKNEVTRPNNFSPVIGPYCEPLLIPVFPCEFKSDSSNFVGNVSLAKQSKTIEYRVAIGQSITPNSNGAEVLRFNIDALAKKKFTERFSTTLGVVAFTQNDVGDTERQFERDYIRARLRMDYRFKRRWSVYGIYRYTFNDQDDNFTDSRTVRNHFLSAGITYRSDGWRW